MHLSDKIKKSSKLIYVHEKLEFICICVRLLFSKFSSWMMCDIHISDGTFQRRMRLRKTCRLREVSGVPPWSLVSISFPNYWSVPTLLGNSISTCHYTTDTCCPPASAMTVLFCQSFPNALLTDVSPFSSSPFALFSWYPASVLKWRHSELAQCAKKEDLGYFAA